MENDLVGPTGLKPAPHGLKGRRSATRAPGQDISHLSLVIFHLPFTPTVASVTAAHLEPTLCITNDIWQIMANGK